MKPKDYDGLPPTAEEGGVGELTPTLDHNSLTLPRQLDLLPMVELNIYPQLVYPISVEDERAKAAVHRCLENQQPLALFAVRDPQADPDHLTEDDFYQIGVAVMVHKVWETDKGHLKVVAQGLSRIKMMALRGPDRLSVSVQAAEDIPGDPEALRPLVLEAKRLFGRVAEMSPVLPFNPVQFGSGLDETPGLMADLMMAALPLKRTAKAEFLGILDVEERLMKLLEHLTLESANLEAGRAVADRMKASLDKRQREMHLREQLKAIEAELGEDDGDDGDDLKALADRLHAKALPDEARKVAERELKRLRKTSSQSSEYGVIRNYLDWILDLPWLESTHDRHDLARAREILERDHFGLEKVKKRIIEYLAVRRLTSGNHYSSTDTEDAQEHDGGRPLSAGRSASPPPILCLVGPPGVGKTSLGRSVAEALGREFVRLSLGGLRDEAEILGHRRTYVGALPGRLISGLKKARSNNPVFLLDELDKMGHSALGDPAAALLEALDPEQNAAFSDHYLEIPFDLSKVVFILTANVLEDIPGPLRDRLEVVEVSGYTQEEKMEIARRHLLPKELERHGLAADDLDLSDQALRDLLEGHTREAGVRDLTRKLGALARARAVDKAEERGDDQVIDSERLTEILGPPRHLREARAGEAQSGVVTGLAWTAAGGDILFIEAVAMPGQGRLSLTGQLGEVMQESAKAAVSYVRSRAAEWHLSPDWFKNHDLHVHLPQGAIPKDGPSAGAALATAIVSLALGRKVRPEVAMTGEISLRGLVLPVGGVKEKLLAAKRAGLERVLIPEKNQADLAELSPHLLDGLVVEPVKNLDEVLARALVDEPADWESIRLQRPTDETLTPEFHSYPEAPGGLSLGGEVTVTA